jgi:hypothetical protein
MKENTVVKNMVGFEAFLAFEWSEVCLGSQLCENGDIFHHLRDILKNTGLQLQSHMADHPVRLYWKNKWCVESGGKSRIA